MICHTLTSTFSCINYTSNPFGFLAQMTLFWIINFPIYEDGKKEETHRGICVFQVRFPFGSQLFASVLPVGLGVNKRKPWGAGSAAEASCRGQGAQYPLPVFVP